MPYAWGGDDTPGSFLDKVTNHNALAGDVCTCRDPTVNDCVYFPKAAGVDCSGFVSRAWGIAKLGTSGLLNVSNKERVSELKPGDALVWPGHHVRLFVGEDSGPAILFRVIESATRRDCEGVCEQSYRATQLNQYIPIRFNHVVDQ
jgi:cell wall-associated NlpC family hydrolase